MKRRQDVSVVRLCDVLLERHNDVPKERNNDAPSLRLHDVSNKSQMKHPTTSDWFMIHVIDSCDLDWLIDSCDLDWSDLSLYQEYLEINFTF